jgi:hypothetical protein
MISKNEKERDQSYWNNIEHNKNDHAVFGPHCVIFSFVTILCRIIAYIEKK